MIQYRFHLSLLCGILLMFIACANEDMAMMQDYAPNGKAANSSANYKEVVPQSKPPSKTISADIADNASFYERQIIKNADCKMQVEDIEVSTRSIRNTIAMYGGFVGNMNLTHHHYRIENQMVLRVPNEQFEALYDALQKEAIHIDHNRINTNDVTDQFVDIQSRLKTKKEVKIRYEQILRKKASTVEEILDTEEKLRKLQEEIDAKEGKLKYLSSKVSLSTITVTLYEVIKHPEDLANIGGPTFFDDVKDSFMMGLEMFRGLFLTIVAIWPIWLILGLLIWWKGKWFRNKLRRKPNAPTTAVTP